MEKLWKDPVGAGIISAGIVALLGAVGTYLLDLWPVVGAWLETVWSALLAPSQLPVWAVGVMGLLALPTIAVPVLVWLQSRRSSQAREVPGSDWKTYTEAMFLGLRWRWTNYDHRMSEPVPFCPHRDYQVRPHFENSYATISRIGFRCDSCATPLPSFEEGFDTLQNRVERLIQQKLRTGAWVSASTFASEQNR